VLVSQVRAALDDDAEEPRWIRTLDRFGYAFAGPATSEALAGERSGPARARLVSREREIVLGEGEHVMGREERASVRADASGVSRQHARLVIAGDVITLEDLGSKNGTFVGDERISSPRVLEEGDELRLGQAVRFTFYRVNDDTETEGPK
jgi:pSer/pThr/pTyr-binding forkhead associated (FHA) protein